MKKKYLSLNPCIMEAEEFVIVAEEKNFRIAKANSLSAKVEIPYVNFKYPEFQKIEAFEEEIAKVICENFGVDNSKLILLQYGEKEEEKVNKMMFANIITFEF